MAEGGGLLNRYTLSRRIEGSNPSGSAKKAYLMFDGPLGRERESNPVDGTCVGGRVAGAPQHSGCSRLHRGTLALGQRRKSCNVMEFNAKYSHNRVLERIGAGF